MGRLSESQPDLAAVVSVMWVELSCNHACWVSWLSAHVGRKVICPGDGEHGGHSGCIGTAQTITTVYGQLEVVA